MVAAENKCPGNWQQFLKEAQNKIELNEYLFQTLSAMRYPSDRQLFVTYKDQVLSNCGKTMPQCDHEEADTCILYHVKHALSEGMSLIQILSNVTILTLGVYHRLRSDYILMIW